MISRPFRASEAETKDSVIIEYDETKNQTNIRKHNISIPELATIFENPFIAPTMDVPDVVHSARKRDITDMAGQPQDGT